MVVPLSVVSPEEKQRTLVDLTFGQIVLYTSTTSPKSMLEAGAYWCSTDPDDLQILSLITGE